MSDVPTFSKCLFIKFFDDFYNHGLPKPQISTSHDAYEIDYSRNLDLFVPYLVDREFVQGKGLNEIVKLSQQQHSLLAHDMIESYKLNDKIPVLGFTNTTSYNPDRFKLFSPNDYASRKVDHLIKPINLLKALYKTIEYSSMFDHLKFPPIIMYECQISTLDELHDLLKYLDQADYLRSNHLREKKELRMILNELVIYPTLTGYKHLNDKTSQNSKKVFIAMQFNWEKQSASIPLTNTENELYVKAVKEACEACDYDASIVNAHHTNYITDQIISEIRESKFIVADFTFNNRGAYFEAGYARALGKDVIHTVSKNHIKGDKDFEQLHFDIQQINYIDWDNYEKLKESLIYRIKALGH